MHSRWLCLWLGSAPRFPEPAFHCTSADQAAAIRRDGFLTGTRGKFGAGVYLTADAPDQHYGPSIVRVAVKLSRPLDTTLPLMADELADVTNGIEVELRRRRRFESESDREVAFGDLMRAELLRRGYDGVVLDDGSGNRGEVVIYNLSSVRVLRNLQQ